MAGLSLLSTTFLTIVGSIILILIGLLVIDITQSTDAIRRNYPVIGRFRGLFTALGEFFRQYFFAMDREELPFNRAERDWVARAASKADNTVAFGSTKNLQATGALIFVNCPFPTLDEDAQASEPVLIGPYCDHPYAARSVFNISGMSFGALSEPAVRALSNGARMAGCWMNTGEGGLSPFHLEGGADIVMQIGTAKYGVRDAEGRLDDDRLRAIAAITQVRMFELKMSQGAKPGKGGILPAAKVTPQIAAIRGIPEYRDSISPNRHPEINSVPELLDMIAHVRRVTGKPTGVKTVIGAYGWVEQLCREIIARGPASAPDFITIDGGNGGTGAAPLALIDNVGLTLQESLPLVVDQLRRFGLDGRVRVIASGKLITPADVAWALCAGADFVNTARGFMFSLGCIQALKCNRNTCPTGITTHNKRLQKGLNPQDKAVKVANYCLGMVHELEVIAHSCGVGAPHQLARKHVRIVQFDGRSVPMDELYPPLPGIDAGAALAASPAERVR